MSLPTFLGFVDQKAQLDEAFNSAPYELTFGKKSAGDIFFTFVDEDEKEFRIQFYTPQGLGKNVRQVFIGQKKGSVYPDAIARFKNPMRVIASMIEATKQYLATPLGKSIDGFAVNFSKKALERGMALIPKIIRQSGLKQKLNVMDLTYAPVPDRGYVWLIKKGKDPAKVFDGPKMQGVTWDDPDKIGDIPDQAVRDAALQGDMDDLGQAINRDWNIGIMSKTAGIESTTVKVDGDKVVLGSKGTAIIVRDRAFAVVAKTQSIAQVTVFDKEYNGRGSVDRKLMAASDRQGMGWELKSGGKILAYIEFGVGAIPGLKVPTNSKDVAGPITQERWDAFKEALSGISGMVVTTGLRKLVGKYKLPGGHMQVSLTRSANSVPGFITAQGEDGFLSNAWDTAKSEVNFKTIEEMLTTIDYMTPMVAKALVKDKTNPASKWQLTSTGPKSEQPMLMWTGTEKGRTITADIIPHMAEIGVYIGGIMNEARKRAPSPDSIVRQLGLPQIPVKMLGEFTQQSSKFWQAVKAVKGSGPVDTSVLPTEGTPESLRADGYIARLLGIVDTYAPQMVGMYSGEKLTRTAAGKYRTSGGLDIQVYFWGINNNGQLSVEVGSELSGHDSFTVSGDTKAAAMEIVNHISQAADSQFSGEVEVKSVPMNGAPYPIKRISHSQGYAFVDCDSFVLKISDALLSRFTVGKAVELDLMREFPRTTFPVRYSWRNKESLVVYAGDGKTIFGDINTKANAKDAIVADNLKKPRNGSFTGESINGFTVMWDLNFPRGSKYEGANLFTNYTVYHDKKKVTVTHMVVKNGSTLNNPKSYEIDMTPASVQSSIDDFSKELETVANQFGTLGSNSYNPNQLFLDDIEVTGYGEFLFQGRNLKQSANRDAIISALAKAPQKDSSGTDLATYLASIEKSAPKGRDIDWQFNASRDGQSINLYWDITFRRNNRVGAFNEFRAQVNAANNYVQQVYNDAKAKGYKPDMPNLMTLADAQRGDQMAYENGDSDYSEYEQSIGGGLVINAK